MSIFPTKVLLATDGSKEADLAARTAAELADKTGSELHLVHASASPPGILLTPKALGLVEQSWRIRCSRRISSVPPSNEPGEAPRRGSGEATLVGHDASASALGRWRSAAGDCWVGRGDRGGLIVMGSRGGGGDQKGLDGERLRFCCEARSLPGHGDQRVK